MILRPYQLDLLNQTREKYKISKRVISVLPCGAGKTVMFAVMCQNHIKINPDGYVWFLVHRQELLDQTIRTFDDNNISRENVLIGMVQTVSRHLDKYQKPSLIVIDECHHSRAKTWMKIIDRHQDIAIIGLTATPCRLDGASLGNVFGAMAVGVSANWLIKNKYLSDYDYYAPKIKFDEAMWKIKGADYDMKTVSASMSVNKIYGDITKYIDSNKKTIIYCPSVNFSMQLAENIGDICRHFDGNTPKKKRREIIADFRSGKIRVLTNVDLIGEGFDVPDCDCCILLRPTMSVALYIQQASRCLRPGKNKRATIYDLVGNVFRHGLPTEDREWSLSTLTRARNRTNDKELLVRACKSCYRIYEGNGKICPYCKHDNGKTRKQIEVERQIELEKIEKLEKKKLRQEVGRCRDFESLVRLGIKRGYKNPSWWAKMIIKGRKSKY